MNGEQEPKMMVRSDGIHAHDKKELTHFVANLMIRPKCGQVILHYNNFMITDVEQIIKVRS